MFSHLKFLETENLNFDLGLGIFFYSFFTFPPFFSSVKKPKGVGGRNLNTEKVGRKIPSYVFTFMALEKVKNI